MFTVLVCVIGDKLLFYLFLVSVQYNMNIMMIKRNKTIDDLISEENKQMYFQRLYLTLETFGQLDRGEYVMLHNPKKPFQVDVYQSCQ